MIWYMRGFTILRYGAASAVSALFLASSKCTTTPARVTSAEASKGPSPLEWLIKVEAFARHRPPVEHSTRLAEAKDSWFAIEQLQSQNSPKLRVLQAIAVDEFLQHFGSTRT